MTRTALFPGSFNPFTIGHKDIVDRTLATLADRVIIAIGVNANKPAADTADRLAAIQSIYADDARVKVCTYSGLTTEFAKQEGADFIVRGIRNATDLEYEQQIAEVNHRLSGIETVMLPTRPELAHVSSSIVRELLSYGINPQILTGHA